MMRLGIFLLLLAAVVLPSCGGATETAKTSQPQKTNSNSISADANTANANVAEPINPKFAPDNTGVNAPRDRRFNRANRPIVDADPSATPLPLQFRPAGEDSQVAVTMNPDGEVFEVRIFNSNPKIAKVEATWLNSKTKDLKIFLRDGGVKHVKTAAITNLQTASLRDLLSIAGMK